MGGLPTKVWGEFQSAVSALADEASSRQILELILHWIRSNYQYLDCEPFTTYGFDRVMKVNERAMPVERSCFTAVDLMNFKNTIMKRQPREGEAIARFLRDTIEELITVEVDEQCPRCKSDGGRIFIGRYNGLLACQCGVCGYSHYSDGTRVKSDELDFASEIQLRELGLN
ncbi:MULTISPECIES: hypothetical protein [Pseudomonas]|uniref:hypothetical protein n=1 Tax=Pseudomonas TaxID=286 RepID=UPI000B34A748|nr:MULTISPECIES: hypothetical protein [Pseudomonas]